jgi:hypothetical protein
MKFFYLFLLVCLTHVVYGQNYNNLLNYNLNGTPTHGIKIKTNIDFTPGSQMPTIRIEGFNYGSGEVIGLDIVYYIYSGGANFSDPVNYYFNTYSISSFGGYTPKVFLSNENGKVIIYLDDKPYYQRFTVSVYAQGMSETSSWFQGWSVVDEPLAGTQTVEVRYRNRFNGDVFLPGSSIWNTSGNVGVGTTTPATAIHVLKSGSANIKLATLNDPVNYTTDIVSNYDSGNAFQITHAGANIIRSTSVGYEKIELGNGTNKNVNILTDNLTIPNGKVGIGTLSPIHALQIVGGHNSTNLSLMYPHPNQTQQANLTLWASEPGLTWTGVGIGNNVSNYVTPAGGTTRISSVRGGSYLRLLDGEIRMNVVKTDGTDLSSLAINPNGNVGIGTTTPNEKLAVNGKIRAHEIKVESTNWPDFVFEDDYKQTSLAELEKYIKANKHLPEIPTANDVAANGVALGEMNRLLLKKIEELTLHLIEKDKIIDRQELRLLTIEKKLKIN